MKAHTLVCINPQGSSSVPFRARRSMGCRVEGELPLALGVLGVVCVRDLGWDA